MKTIYSELDKQLKTVKQQISDEFTALSLVGFDELNVIGTKKRTEKIYSKLKNINEKAYIKSAKEAYNVAEKSAILAGFPESKAKTGINTKWLSGVLGAYYLVTGYLYEKEAERKRLRLNEEILTAREYLDHAAFRKAAKRSMDLWWTQSQQYGIFTADKACLDAYRDHDVTLVKWITELDGHECGVCRERDGKIYRIDQIPEKPHYGCRCRFDPVIKE